MNKQVIIFSLCGMLIDTIVLFSYYSYYGIKQGRKYPIVISYSMYFLINFIVGNLDLPFCLKIISNLLMIFTIGVLFYKDVSKYEAGKAAITFLLLLGVAELLVIPFGFVLSGTYDIGIFDDPSRPYLWILSMGLSRIIALLLFRFYRKIQKRKHGNLDKQELWILYLPLAVSLVSYMTIIRTTLDIKKVENEDLIFLLTAIAITLAIYTLIHMIFFERYVKYRDESQELSMLNQKNALQLEYYKNKKETFENMRVMYHDLKNHLLISSYDLEYSRKIKKIIKKFDNLSDTGNQILDILIWEKSNEASKLGIRLLQEVEKINLKFIEDIDICPIFGNVLDNAIEACGDMNDNLNPEICLKIRLINRFVVIKVENDCMRKLSKKGDAEVFKTTKKDAQMHGVGLCSVERAVDKYDGNCVFECLDDKFIAEILIPLPIIP